MKASTLAAIDIGSNAVRLLINAVEAGPGGPEFKKLAFLRVPIRLGEDVFTLCRISDAKADRLMEAMQSFSHLMRAYAVSGFRACATSAMRDADNGKELARAIKKMTGIDIEIVSGAQEAGLICAAGAPPQALCAGEICLYADVGGGSTELAVCADRQVRFHDSFRIGTIRILNNAVAEAEKTRFAHSLEKIRRHHAPAYLVAFGGNISRAYAMLDKTGDDLIRLHELETLCAKLRALRREGRMQVCNLDGHKADAIVPALEIFIEIVSACPSLRGVCVSKTGLGDGLIRDLYKQLQA